MNTSSKTYKLVLTAILSAIVIVLRFIPVVGFIPLGPFELTTLIIPVILGAIYGGPYVGMIVGFVFGIMSLTMVGQNPVFYPVWLTGKFRNYLLICVTTIVPRILIGLFAALFYRLFKNISKKTSLILLAIFGIAMLGFSSWKLVTMISEGSAFGQYYIFVIMIVATIGVGIWLVATLGKRSISIVLASAIGVLTNTVLFLTLTFWFFADIFVELIPDILGASRQAIGNVLFSIGVANGIPELIVTVILVSAVAAAIKPKELKNK